MWHAAATEFGHPVEQDGSIGISRREDLGTVNAERALRGTHSQHIGSFERQVMPHFGKYGAAGMLSMAMSAVYVQVGPRS